MAGVFVEWKPPEVSAALQYTRSDYLNHPNRPNRLAADVMMAMTVPQASVGITNLAEAGTLSMEFSSVTHLTGEAVGLLGGGWDDGGVAVEADRGHTPMHTVEGTRRRASCPSRLIPRLGPVTNRSNRPNRANRRQAAPSSASSPCPSGSTCWRWRTPTVGTASHVLGWRSQGWL
jgi:hypothetical protein